MHLYFAAGSVLTPMGWSGSMGSCAAGSASAATPRTLASSRYPCMCSGLIIVINLAQILVEVSSIICDCYILASVDKYNCFQLHVGLHLPSLEVIKLAVFLMLLVTNFRLISVFLHLQYRWRHCLDGVENFTWGWKRNRSFNRRLNLCALAFCSDLRLMC